MITIEFIEGEPEDVREAKLGQVKAAVALQTAVEIADDAEKRPHMGIQALRDNLRYSSTTVAVPCDTVKAALAEVAELEARLREAEEALEYKVEIAPDDLLATMLARAQAAEQEAARYREALKIYAKPENWQPHKRQERVIWNWHPYEDGFKIAQSALYPATQPEPPRLPDGRIAWPALEDAKEAIAEWKAKREESEGK